jgi:hypothetical protein
MPSDPPFWGSRGRRFKSGRPDDCLAGQRPDRREGGQAFLIFVAAWRQRDETALTGCERGRSTAHGIVGWVWTGGQPQLIKLTVCTSRWPTRPCSAEHRAGGLRHANTNQTQTAETRHNAISNQIRPIPESGRSVPGQAWK